MNTNMLKGLSIVTAVVDTKSLVRAAELLNMTQSGVSRALARFEKHLGIRLFDRTTRTINLTDEGKQFYQQVLPALTIIDEAVSHASGSKTSVRGLLRVNIDPFFSRLRLSQQLKTFLELYPNLELNITTRDHLGDIIADGFDLAVRFGEPPSSSLIARKLFETRILTVASPKYIAQYGQPKNPSDLEKSNHNCIHFRDPNTGRPFEWEFHKKGLTLPVTVKSRLILNDVSTMHEICLSGFAIAQVMELGVETYLESGSLINLFPDWTEEYFPLYALYPSRHLPPAKVRAFLDFIIALSK